MTLTFGSLFSGLGAFDYAFMLAGMRCRWQVEIDLDCARVLDHHWPSKPRFRDVRECGKHNLEPVDVICFGSPCQDWSVAGKREGITGSRGQLFHEATRIVRELQPTIVCFENVPGLLSCAGGRDFLEVIRSFRQCGPCDLAWRTIDSRHCGVPQRRRRVFLIADFGGERAAEILVESPCCCGHPPTCGQAEADLTGTLGSSPAGAGWRDDLDRAGTFIPDTAFCQPSFHRRVGNAYNSTYIAGSVQPGQRWASGNTQQGHLIAFDERNQKAGDVVPTLKSHPAGSSAQPFVFSATGSGAFRTGAGTLAASDDNGSNHLVTYALRSEGADASEDGTGRGTPLVAFNVRPQDAEGNGPHAYESPVTKCLDDDVSPSLKVGSGVGAPAGPAVASGMMVRRLLPVECLRLMGLKDNWLDLDPPLSDSAKYRLIGNSLAVPVAMWIGKRIVKIVGNRSKS